MRGLLQFLFRNSSFLLFLLLEGVSFFMIVRFNDEQQRIWLSTASAIAGSANKIADDFTNYFSLGRQNSELLAENAALRKRLHQLLLIQRDSLAGDSISREDLAVILKDSIFADTSKNLYSFIPANIINNSIIAEDNILTLDKGRNDGIQKDMGVVSSEGIVGIVLNVSDHYATVMSILHRQSRVSASIRRTGYFGTLRWYGKDSRFMYLDAIPRHEDVKKGDIIQTSGYSNIFPKDIRIGVVDTAYVARGDDYHTIRVKLSADLGKLNHAYVVVNKDAEELKSLELRQSQ